ncbi:protein-disulfide reductase DsbD domain-containing protein [Oceanisphaera pacifica]|uniref:Cytochrome C biogenesis protein n=1 Tax=Oceanisphaera pacifica TaxID=2818389 RepID=A0ABS3NDB9_9GAMM|nr:protein-disulfide reductase DsbD domain-containing protein [Oceanisphaera pacifica]MBO1518372.1 cytochrome C biogenesis protein [Oceanisphaera pacifica]
MLTKYQPLAAKLVPPSLALACLFAILPVQAGLFDWLGGTDTTSNKKPDFLPVEQAFVLSSEQKNNQLQLSFSIAPQHYLYRHTIEVSAKQAALGDWTLPNGKPHQDEYFGKSQVYYQQLTLEIPLNAVEQDALVEVRYQGCTTGLCYPPQTIKIALQ